MLNFADGSQHPIRYASTKELASHFLKDAIKEARAWAYHDITRYSDYIAENGEDRLWRKALEEAEEKFLNCNIITVKDGNQEYITDKFEIKEIDVETEISYDREQDKLIIK